MLSALVAVGLAEVILLWIIFCDGHVQAKDELNSAFRHLFSHVAQQHLCIKEDNFYSVNSEKGGIAEVYMMALHLAFGISDVIGIIA